MREGQQPAKPKPGWTWARIARRIRIPLGFLSAAFFVWLARPTPTSLLEGALVMVPGLLLRGFASGHVQKDKQLTTSGPYAYTRNPLYLGSLLLAAGFAVKSCWLQSQRQHDLFLRTGAPISSWRLKPWMCLRGSSAQQVRRQSVGPRKAQLLRLPVFVTHIVPIGCGLRLRSIVWRRPAREGH